MRYRRIGRSPIFVSEIGLGTMNFGHQCSKETSKKILDTAVSMGVNLIDTAEIYPVPSTKEGYGLSEEILGDWLKTKDRDSVIISSKAAGPAHAWYRSPARSGMASLDRVHLRKALEGSLRRLNTDYIDIYQAHWPDHGMCMEELLEVFNDFVTEGKIRVFGCSNETSWGLMKGLWLSDTKKFNRRVEFIQNNYSFNNRRFEDELAEVCLYEEISLIAYSPLSGGVLTGKYNHDDQQDKYRFNNYLLIGQDRQQSIAQRYVNPRTLLSAQHFCNVAQQEGVHPATLAIAWVNSSDFVASSLVGASLGDHLKDTLKALDYQISSDAFHELEKISSSIPYPMEYI